MNKETTVAKFKVVGAHAVGGVAPGGTVELDLPEANIEALIRSGNVEPAKAGAAPPPREPTTPDPGVPEKARKGGE